MYLKKSKSKKSGRTHLSIAQNYWDNINKKSKTKTIESLGYLDELLKKFTDPISHFESVVARMNEDQQMDKASNTITIDMGEKIDGNNTARKNFGYAALSKIYHELEIDKFMFNRQRNLDVEYSLNNITKLMVFSRLLAPCSKKKTFESKDFFFENSNFSLVDVY